MGELLPFKKPVKSELSALEDSFYSDVPDIHPLIKDTEMVLDKEELEDGSTLYTARFLAGLGGSAITELVGGPMQELVDGHNKGGVIRGLKDHAYPNTRLARNAHTLGNGAPEHLNTIRGDIRGLLKTIENDEHYANVPADVVLYDQMLAELCVRDEILKMKPKALKKLCDRMGISVDEMAMWRMKGGKRGSTQLEDIESLGIDPAELINGVVDSKFAKRTLVDHLGTQQVLIDRKELPSDELEKETAWPFVEQIRQLPKVKTYDVGNRSRIVLHQDNLPAHRVDPVLRWLKTEGRSRHLIFGEEEAYYSPKTNLVTHESSVLGVAALAGSLDNSDLLYPARRLFNLRNSDNLPPRASGALPIMFGGTDGVAWQLAARSDKILRELEQTPVDEDY